MTKIIINNKYPGITLNKGDKLTVVAQHLNKLYFDDIFLTNASEIKHHG